MTTTKPKFPTHIAIVMDGNGRWAKQKGFERLVGHQAGRESARKIIEACSKKSIPILTLFAFGQENWRRPSQEVEFLMELFLQSLKDETDALKKNNVRLRFIGDLSAFNPNLQLQIRRSEEETATNQGLTLLLAVNYSGQWDIVQAAQRIARQVRDQQLRVQDITDHYFQQALSTADLPPPDLFIRTSGEQRISNFLLWQLAYTELYFTETLWPDFDESELERALDFYSKRERRYGLTSEQLQVERLKQC